MEGRRFEAHPSATEAPEVIHRRWAARPGAALGWGLAFFVLGQLTLLLAMECWWPELADPEYGIKLACLRARLAERPDCRPLIVALGSSRVPMGLRPEHLVVNRSSDSRGPLVFNFGIYQSGPTAQLLCLRRLLADGVRPDVMAMELYAPMLAEDYAAAPPAIGLPSGAGVSTVCIRRIWRRSG
jgi:hypothetical protein